MLSKDIKPYLTKELFRVNPEASIELVTVGDVQVLVIDDWWLNPDDVRDYAISCPCTGFIPFQFGIKNNNQISYEDLRLDTVTGPMDEASMVINKLAGKYLGFKSYDIVANFVVNIFKNIEGQTEQQMPHPHQDGQAVVGLVYLNKGLLEHEGEGGTAIYRSIETGKIWTSASDAKKIKKVDVGNEYYSDVWEQGYEIVGLITNKFNRLLIYPGRILHGAYHLPNQYNESYRMTQVLFHTNMEPTSNSIQAETVSVN